MLMTETRPRLGLAAHTGRTSGVLGGRVRDFIALMKPRPMSVVVFTALAGLLAAPGQLTLWQGLVAMACIAAGGGGSAVLNMWFERDLDARMARTASRPIPSGRISPQEALVFALLLIGTSLLVMWLAVNPMAAVMLAATILFYGVVYTMWLKRQTALNVVIGGGLASLLTPLTGWAAATGQVSWQALAVFAFLVPWTPPHVWSQALVRSADYAGAGVPMMPVVVGSARTRQLIAAFTAAHALLALLPAALGVTGGLWFAAALVGGAGLVWESLRLARMSDGPAAREVAWRFYRLNSLYVVALFVALVIERASGAAVLSLPSGISG